MAKRSFGMRGGPYNGKLTPLLELNENDEPPIWLHCVPAFPADSPELDAVQRAAMDASVLLYKRRWSDEGFGRTGYWYYVFTEQADALGTHPVVNEKHTG